MSDPKSNIRIPVDRANPGQFFACCGLLELADRLWPGAQGWFEQEEFCIFTADRSKLLNDLFEATPSTRVVGTNRIRSTTAFRRIRTK